MDQWDINLTYSAERSELARIKCGSCGSYHASVDEVRICCSRAEEIRAEIETELAAEAFLECRDASMARQIAREVMARRDNSELEPANIEEIETAIRSDRC